MNKGFGVRLSLYPDIFSFSSPRPHSVLNADVFFYND